MPLKKEPELMVAFWVHLICGVHRLFPEELKETALALIVSKI